MADFFTYLALFVMVVVAIVLVMGLFNMARGGSANRSQQLMRARVLFQAVAVVLIVGALLFMNR